MYVAVLGFPAGAVPLTGGIGDGPEGELFHKGTKFCVESDLIFSLCFRGIVNTVSASIANFPQLERGISKSTNEAYLPVLGRLK
jgi:hypothetical protein